MLDRLGIHCQPVDATADLSGFDILVIGKAGLTLEGAAPDISKVRDGLKVIVFEQTSAVLEKRLGFRVEEYGLRQLFPRIKEHPALAGLQRGPRDRLRQEGPLTPALSPSEGERGNHRQIAGVAQIADSSIGVAELRDWRGESTIVPPRLTYKLEPRYGPTVEWCGLTVPHLWRCGNRGDVASVLIEKPTTGDFLPILDGGFSLQFSPLLEYREGKGLVVFCQVDVTGRSETEPAAEVLVGNLLRYVASWTPTPRREVLYAGEPAGKRQLESIGLTPRAFDRAGLSSRQLLVVGPGGAQQLAPEQPALEDWLGKGGRVLMIGLPGAEINSVLPLRVFTINAEHISGSFQPFSLNSVFAGIGPANLHNRDPRNFPLITTGAEVVGDGVLAAAKGENVVFDQMPPWQFNDSQPNLKRTHRRSSFALSRLLGNLGAAYSTPLLDRFHDPVTALTFQNRCLSGLYLDTPQEWDDPYRHFRW